MRRVGGQETHGAGAIWMEVENRRRDSPAAVFEKEAQTSLTTLRAQKPERSMSSPTTSLRTSMNWTQK